jgi:hypothetical protein
MRTKLAQLGSHEVLREQILLRLANIEDVAQRALEADGGVVIW